MTEVRLRMAVVPTGHLTLNAARIALANARFAQQCRDAGRDTHLILRIDDLHPERVRPAYAATIARDLSWLGVTTDEIVAQSTRADRHAEAIEALRTAGRLYPCFESEPELRAKSEQRRRRGRPDVYDRAMLALTPAQRAAAEAGGKRPHWRFRLSPDTIAWHDRILGARSAKLTAISDPILVRDDGACAPLLAGAIDDLDLGITDLIRAEENLSDTGVYLDVLAALRCAAMPRITSVPGLDGATPAGRKSGSRPVRDLRTDGVLAPVLAAWLTGEDADPHGFRLEQLRVVPDPTDLLAGNRQALGAMPFGDAAAFLPTQATDRFWHAICGGIDLARDAGHWWNVVTGHIAPALAADDADILRTARSCLPAEPWDDLTWDTWRAAIPLDRAAVSRALYRALTGEEDGPGMARLLPMIGRDRADRRLADAIG